MDAHRQGDTKMRKLTEEELEDIRAVIKSRKYKTGKCDVCGKVLNSALPQGIVIENYSKRYMTKEGYDGIVIATNNLFDRRYRTRLRAILCLVCFVRAKRTYGWQEGSHYDPDSDVL